MDNKQQMDERSTQFRQKLAEEQMNSQSLSNEYLRKINVYQEIKQIE